LILSVILFPVASNALQPVADSAPIIRTEHLTREVAGRRIVDDISVEVQQGDVLAIVGPSGAGKSSFLRLLNRLDEPTSGTFYVGGRDYREILPRVLRRRLGMVMQTAFLFPGTVAENIRFGPRQHGEQLNDDAIARLLEQVGLPGFAGRNVANLSGAEAQRVAFARCLANGPEVLLLDEPTSALDDAAKRGIEALVREIVEASRLTCLIVTHDTAQAARLAQRVMIIEHGKLSRIGSLQEVFGVERTI
jgi:putative ABC transport system ATP-binding protein